MAKEIWRTHCRHCEAVVRVTETTPSRDEPGGGTSYVIRCSDCGEKDTHFRSAAPRRATATVIEEGEPGEDDINHEPEVTSASGGLPRDTFAWAIVAVPIMAAVAGVVIGPGAMLVSFVFNLGFCIADYQILTSRGFRTPAWAWAVFLIPVYLWRRCTILRQSRHYFAAWVLSFVVSIALIQVFDHNDIENSACPVVTRIVQEKLGGTAKCIRVKITENVGGGYYKAIATLSDGSDLRVMIEDRGNSIYVTVRR